MRFVLAGDLAGDWADFGGLADQVNLIALVTDMSITDRPGIPITYDLRTHRHIRKLAQKRSRSTNYFPTLSTAQPDIKAGVLRDFGRRARLIKKEKEAGMPRRRRPWRIHRRIRGLISARGGQTTNGRPGRRPIGRNRRPRRTRRRRIPRRRNRRRRDRVRNNSRFAQNNNYRSYTSLECPMRAPVSSPPYRITLIRSASSYSSVHLTPPSPFYRIKVTRTIQAPMGPRS